MDFSWIGLGRTRLPPVQDDTFVLRIRGLGRTTNGQVANRMKQPETLNASIHGFRAADASLVPAGEIPDLDVVADVLRAQGRERALGRLVERRGELEAQLREDRGLGLDARRVLHPQERASDELDIDRRGQL